MSKESQKLAEQKYQKKRRERQQYNYPFLAVDSEGGAWGEEYTSPDQSPGIKRYQPHKSFLWGLGDTSGDVEWLYSPTPLSSRNILDYLLDLGEANPRGIFVAFAFGYDVAQIVADMPYEKAWELQHGKPYKDKDDPDVRKNSRRSVLWHDYAISYLKGKMFTIRQIIAWDETKHKYIFSKHRKIKIVDVHGFFQGKTFLKAISSMGVVTPDEFQLIAKGKAVRGQFDHSKLEETKEYTRHELMLLCRMMDKLRDAMAGLNIFPTSWHGAGALAQALMKREGTREHLPKVYAEWKGISDDVREQQEYAFRAYVGGRIELCKVGATRNMLYGYDVSSAYPFHLSTLPSMAGGHWTTEYQTIDNPLTMVRLRAQFAPDLPFYPLPYRTPDGSIYFPQNVYGVYMADEYRAARSFMAKFGGTMTKEKVWHFVPGNNERPLKFLADMFEARNRILVERPGDITELVIKLGINALYGKFGQSVGQWREAPALSCPWYAAAATARTRAQLLRAAMIDPGAVVMFATDGLFTTRPLEIECAKVKTFGAWDGPTLHAGGVFVQSGVYCLADPGDMQHGQAGARPMGWLSKSRGFRPAEAGRKVEDILWQDIPAQWRAGSDNYAFPYKSYMTLGASVASVEQWARCGQWVSGSREIALKPGQGGKRALVANASEKRRRASRLIDTVPDFLYSQRHVDENMDLLLSDLHKPEWLDADFGAASDDDQEQDAIAAGMS